VYCQIAQVNDLVYLVLPVVPIPEVTDISSGAYLVKVDFVNETGEIVGIARDFLYFENFPDSITPMTLNIFPTSIDLQDTIAVTIEGKASNKFTELYLQTVIFYTRTRPISIQSELTVLNLTWQED